MYFHISWLEVAIKKMREVKDGSGINGDLTIEEFVYKYLKDELEKVIEIK